MRIIVLADGEANFTEMELPAVPRVGELIESGKYGTWEVETVAWFTDEEDPVPHVVLRSVD